MIIQNQLITIFLKQQQQDEKIKYKIKETKEHSNTGNRVVMPSREKSVPK